ncbi:aminoglycoside 6-adenylyltransferase [Cellulosilyticum ruminicola]|uniref:aminoglycoside 6-adenylyltransferase n=1 Tax=Cellulosilyticum ruminicola TaxID=425254 RepID=UPI0006D00C22|nr:aminoglycoside 6-adenylyltransferase [Cellulosilyticum ruminicola]
MRSEKEMYELILNIANDDSRIQAVYMNGSRTNPNALKDLFQDYDIVYVVNETLSFIEDKDWIKNFGEILYMQYPDESPNCESDKANCYGWLMQFTDGNRIDLHVVTLEYAKKDVLADKLCQILLDKNNILPIIPPATDEDHHIKKPNEAQYLAVCNEFWWCTNNLAKGLWRKELPYVQDMTNFCVRKQLEKMLSFKIGLLTNFSVSIGKSGKYMHRWLTEKEWQTYLATYFGSNTEEAFKAIITMCDLFEETALFVGSKLGYTYNIKEAKAARSFLEHVYNLPSDANEIY